MTLIPMVPVADVSAILPPGSRLSATPDGRYVFQIDRGPGIPFVMEMDTLRKITFTTQGNADPYTNAFMRNFIPNLFFDCLSQRFVGIMPPGPLFNRFRLADKNGATTYYDYPLSSQLINDEGIAAAVPLEGVIFGFVEFNGFQPPTSVFWVREISGTVIQAPAFAGFHGFTIFGSNDPAISHGLLRVTKTPSDPQNAINFFRARPDLGYLGETFPDINDPLFPVKTNLSAYGGIFDDQGQFNNYNFINWRNKLFVSINQVTIDPILGIPLTPNINIGPNSFTPAFPLSFHLAGHTYSFGFDEGNPGTYRYGAAIGDSLYVIADMAETDGVLGNHSNVLFTTGLAELSLIQQDTLNWKRSLNYDVDGFFRMVRKAQQ
jgi:hypothetical protein